MADETFEFKTWERQDIDFTGYISDNCFFIILDHEFVPDSGHISPDSDENILYSGFAPYGKIFAVNEIVSKYIINPNFMDISWTGWSREKPKFYIYFTNSDWSEYEDPDAPKYYFELKVIYDWTYDSNIEYSAFLSNPISNIMDYRQYFVVTFQNTEADSADLEYFETYFDEERTYTGNSVNDTIATSRFYIQDFWDWDGNDIVFETYSENSPHFSGIITDTCKQYCIYYMNRRGGWDWLLVNGKSLKSDKISRLTYKANYWPQHQTSMNKIPYVTTVTENFEFTTSWMNNNDAEKISDLVESNKVVVHDLVNNIIYTAVMTNSSVDYKTYINQGRKLYAYTLNMEVSQPRYRIDKYYNELMD